MNVELSYIAGFFDGEGCIHGQLRKQYPDSKERQVRVGITIVQKDPYILRYIKDYFGFGRVYKVVNNKGRTHWRYVTFNSSDVYKFLRSLEIYCIGKRPQLLIAIELAERISRKNYRRMNSEERVIRVKMMNEITKLKKELIR